MTDYGRHEPQQIVQSGGGGGTDAIISSTRNFVGGTSVSLQRPNNTTAFTATGQVYGPAVDARVSLVVPALPSNSRLSFFNSLLFLATMKCSPTRVAMSFNIAGFTAQPATVLAGNADFNLSDADILLMFPLASPVVNVSVVTIGGFTIASQQVQNPSAGLNGRITSSGNAAAQNGFLTPGNTLWFYIVVTNAHTPEAQETLTLTPYWTYTASE